MPQKKISAGLLMYRIPDGQLQVLLAHPGGPFFKNKDDGAWSIPKGEIELDEDLLEAAKREFTEEIGITATGPFIEMTPVKQKGGKIVHAWAFVGNCDPAAICQQFVQDGVASTVGTTDGISRDRQSRVF